MKHLKFLSLLLLVGLFITSCQRDEIEEDVEIKNQSEIQLRSYNQEDCGFINSFCEKQSNILVAVHELESFQPCPTPPCFTGGGDDVTSMRVLPVKIFDGTTAVYLEDNNEAYFMINSEHPAFEGKTIERSIPNGIRALLDIEYRDISDGTKLLEDIQNSTQININSTGSGTFNVSSIDDGGGTISALIRYCDYRRVSEVESFIEVFFDGTNDPPTFVRGFIEDGFESAENNPDCIIEGYTGSGYSKCHYDCIDPRCVIDYLLDINAGLSDDRKNIMIAQYLGEALGLTNEEIDFLSLPSNSTFTSDLYSQLGSELNLGECENEDCSMRYSVETLIDLEMSGQTSTMSSSEQFEFYANLYCCDEPSLLTEVEDIKLNGYPNPTTDAILEGMSNMCCGENAMSQSEFASLMADQLNAELASIGESWPTSPDFFDNDFFEIMFEMMKEIVPELIPGVDTYIELKNAMEAYDNGNYWQSAESFAFAVLTVTPADKCKDFVKVFKTGRKGFKIFRLFDKLKALSPSLAEGFKKAVLDRNKMDFHWFIKKHNLGGLVKKVGGKENVIFEIYRKIDELGLSALVPNSPGHKDFVINIQGIEVTVRLTKVNGVVRIGTLFIPTA